MTFLLGIWRMFPPRFWFGLLLLLAIAGLWAAYRAESHRADQAEIAARSAKASTKALERVATQTPIIIADQEEKQRAVDKIEGADDRLPDGFGRELERVRRGNRTDDPR